MDAATITVVKDGGFFGHPQSDMGNVGYMESQAPGIGIFGIAGAVGFVLGAFLLFGGFQPSAIPTPNYRVSTWLLVTVSVVLFALLAVFFRFVVAAARKTEYVSPSGNLVG